MIENIESMVLKKTNKYVYLKDGTHITHSDFHKLKNDIRKEYAKVHQSEFENSKLATVVQQSVVEKRLIDFVVKPNQSNRRFICGYEDKDKFRMVFWNYFKDVTNGHGELEAYYQKTYNQSFHAVSGGFYMSNGHNHIDSLMIEYYLFGASSTFRNFEMEIDQIKQYGIENNLRFIIGKTKHDRIEPLSNPFDLMVR